MAADDALHADDVKLLAEVGYLAAGAGLYAEALDVFNGLAVLRPVSAVPYLGLATVHLNRRQPDEAAAVLERAQQLLEQPDDLGNVADADDRALVAAFRGVALHCAHRHAESDRVFRSIGTTHDTPAARIARGMLGLTRPGETA